MVWMIVEMIVWKTVETYVMGLLGVRLSWRLEVAGDGTDRVGAWEKTGAQQARRFRSQTPGVVLGPMQRLLLRSYCCD